MHRPWRCTGKHFTQHRDMVRTENTPSTEYYQVYKSISGRASGLHYHGNAVITLSSFRQGCVMMMHEHFYVALLLAK